MRSLDFIVAVSVVLFGISFLSGCEDTNLMQCDVVADKVIEKRMNNQERNNSNLEKISDILYKVSLETNDTETLNKAELLQTELENIDRGNSLKIENLLKNSIQLQK